MKTFRIQDHFRPSVLDAPQYDFHLRCLPAESRHVNHENLITGVQSLDHPVENRALKMTAATRFHEDGRATARDEFRDLLHWNGILSRCSDVSYLHPGVSLLD